MGSFRVTSTNGSQVTVYNIAKKMPKITLVRIMKACKILGCNSEYFWRYGLSNFLFGMAFLPSRLICQPSKHHIYTLYTDRGLKLYTDLAPSLSYSAVRVCQIVTIYLSEAPENGEMFFQNVVGNIGDGGTFCQNWLSWHGMTQCQSIHTI